MVSIRIKVWLRRGYEMTMKEIIAMHMHGLVFKAIV